MVKVVAQRSDSEFLIEDGSNAFSVDVENVRVSQGLPLEMFLKRGYWSEVTDLDGAERARNLFVDRIDR